MENIALAGKDYNKAWSDLITHAVKNVFTDGKAIQTNINNYNNSGNRDNSALGGR